MICIHTYFCQFVLFFVIFKEIRIDFINFNRIFFHYFFGLRLCFLFLNWPRVLDILKFQILESLGFFWKHLFFFDLFFFNPRIFNISSHSICNITVFIFFVFNSTLLKLSNFLKISFLVILYFLVCSFVRFFAS